MIRAARGRKRGEAVSYTKYDKLLLREMEKMLARIEDGEALANGTLTAEELNRRNNFFKGADFSRAVIVGRKRRKRAEEKRG